MRSLMSLVVLALVTSCASSGSSPAPEIVTPTERVVATDTHGTYRTTVAPSVKAHVPVSPSRVFDALKSVYEEMGVPPAINDPTTGRVGNTDFWKTRKGWNRADLVVSQLRRFDHGSGGGQLPGLHLGHLGGTPGREGESELETALSAQARNMEGTTSDLVACGTTGRLEQRIRQRLLDKLSASDQ